MANAAGGALVYGVDEKRAEDGRKLGVPGSIPGCEGHDDEQKQAIESILNSMIDPRLPLYDVNAVDGGEHGPVVLIRVGRSWTGPHAVRNRYYSRTSAGKYLLTTEELRRAFVEHHSRLDALERTRTERLGRIAARATTYPLIDADGILALHMLPVVPNEVDLHASYFNEYPARVPLLARAQSHVDEARQNMEGKVFAKVVDKRMVPSYTQVFRSGGVEAATSSVHVYEAEGQRAVSLERAIAAPVGAFVGSILANPASYGLQYPLFAALSVFGLGGCIAGEAREDWLLGDFSLMRYSLDRDAVVPPGHILNEPTTAEELSDLLVGDVRRAFGL